MALRACLVNTESLGKFKNVIIRDFAPICLVPKRQSSTRPLPADDSRLKRLVAPAISITDDGIYKRHGQLLNATRTIDGKPIFPGAKKNFKLQEGDFVRAGQLVCHQRRLEYHPGLHVGLGRKLALYAFETGIVYITWEKVNCNWDLWLNQEYYKGEEDMDIYKPHYHVIPKEMERKFKLVSRI